MPIQDFFEVEEEDSEVKQSKWNDCVNLKKVGQEFQGDFITVAQSKKNDVPTLIPTLSA